MGQQTDPLPLKKAELIARQLVNASPYLSFVHIGILQRLACSSKYQTSAKKAIRDIHSRFEPTRGLLSPAEDWGAGSPLWDVPGCDGKSAVIGWRSECESSMDMEFSLLQRIAMNREATGKPRNGNELCRRLQISSSTPLGSTPWGKPRSKKIETQAAIFLLTPGKSAVLYS